MSHAELYDMFVALEFEVTPQLIINLVSAVDDDNSGDLSFEEFVALIALVKEALANNATEQTGGETQHFVANMSTFSEEELVGFRDIFHTVGKKSSPFCWLFILQSFF